MIAQVDDLTREGARRSAREELSRREYDDAQPPLVFRIVGRLLRELAELLDRAAGGVPGGRFSLVVLLLLLLLLVGLVLSRTGPLARRTAPGQLFDGSRALTADEHRALAEQAAQAGRYADAVRERLRALVRELEARGVLDPRPGRTAGEVARDAGAVVPQVGAPLRRAATVFDEVWYGGRTADASSYAVLVEVDRAVSDSRLVVA